MISTFYLLSFLCFEQTCQPMPRLGPGPKEQCEVALDAIVNRTPLPPGFYVVAGCVEELQS